MPGGQEYVEPAAADVIESKGGEVHGMAILLDKGQFLNDVRRTLSLVDPPPLIIVTLTASYFDSDGKTPYIYDK